MYIIAIIVLILIILVLSLYIYQIRKKLSYADCVLKDIQNGNLNRKLVVNDNSKLSKLFYNINEIVEKCKSEIMDFKQSEKAYKRLVTNLSHDIRTPLASLIGYLSAVEDKIVIENEKEDYIKLSHKKAFVLKNYIDMLFEWLKLESGEQIFHFEKTDICELSREIMIGWILQFEQNKIKYQINIPDKEIELLLDESSYRRIVNNLMQNIILHSQAKNLKIEIEETSEKINVNIEDDGIGISENELPHIFERLYKCEEKIPFTLWNNQKNGSSFDFAPPDGGMSKTFDSSRNSNGNGLGLSIVSELVSANKGTIKISSALGKGCCFSIEFTKN